MLRKSPKQHFADPSMAVGIGAVDVAADNLLRIAAKIDTNKTKAPTALTVITGNGFAYNRPDGVNVVPISTLTI